MPYLKKILLKCKLVNEMIPFAIFRVNYNQKQEILQEVKKLCSFEVRLEMI